LIDLYHRAWGSLREAKQLTVNRSPYTLSRATSIATHKMFREICHEMFRENLDRLVIG